MAQKTREPLYNPATGEIITNIQEDSLENFKEMLFYARKVQKEWATLPLKQRAGYIRRLGQVVLSKMDEIAHVIAQCTGKTRMDALSTEVVPAVIASNYYARAAQRFLKKQKVKRSSLLFFHKHAYLQHEPYGVIGIISPWNYPFGIPFHEVVMAIMAGNAVILKVATQVQPVGDLLKELVTESGLPEGLFRLVHIPGTTAGKIFIEEGLDKIFFTGSTEAGKKLMAKAAEKLIPLCLELGGKDAMIVLRDANLKRAALGAIWAGLSNAGQSCGSVERLYVEDAIYDDFLGYLKSEISKLRLGVDKDHNVDIGALTSQQQLAKIKEQVKKAIEQGANAYSASFNRMNEASITKSGLFHPLMILEKVTGEMELMQEETFGPVLAVEKVKDINEAIEKANHCLYGLTASIWTNDYKQAQLIANQLEAGVVTINDHLMSHGMPETPWGGYKQSGFGRTHGQAGFEEMTRLKVVVKEHLPFLIRNLWWHPHNLIVYNGLKAAVGFFYRPGLRGKLQGLRSIFKLMLERFRV
jgi:succinate-semialdehyde dehydrogenase/glutarate-semialdehyde dehydrogenase